jgi:hypothetical protein
MAGAAPVAAPGRELRAGAVETGLLERDWLALALALLLDLSLLLVSMHRRGDARAGCAEFGRETVGLANSPRATALRPKAAWGPGRVWPDGLWPAIAELEAAQRRRPRIHAPDADRPIERPLPLRAGAPRASHANAGPPQVLAEPTSEPDASLGCDVPERHREEEEPADPERVAAAFGVYARFIQGERGERREADEGPGGQGPKGAREGEAPQQGAAQNARPVERSEPTSLPTSLGPARSAREDAPQGEATAQPAPELRATPAAAATEPQAVRARPARNTPPRHDDRALAADALQPTIDIERISGWFKRPRDEPGDEL